MWDAAFSRHDRSLMKHIGSALWRAVNVWPSVNSQIQPICVLCAVWAYALCKHSCSLKRLCDELTRVLIVIQLAIRVRVYLLLSRTICTCQTVAQFQQIPIGLQARTYSENALLRMLNDVYLAADRESSTMLLQLDLSSAFDTLDIIYYATSPHIYFRCLWPCPKLDQFVL